MISHILPALKTTNSFDQHSLRDLEWILLLLSFQNIVQSSCFYFVSGVFSVFLSHGVISDGETRPRTVSSLGFGTFCLVSS